MIKLFKKEDKFSYVEMGEGVPIVALHGIMGGLSNFDTTLHYFSKCYRVIVPELPLYELPLLSTSVKGLCQWVFRFIEYKKLDKVILLGNSLGGHIALLLSKLYPNKVKALILTGSSGLYENAMGSGYLKRGDYEFIRKKCEEVFYDPKVATKQIVDEVFATVNDRAKVVKSLAIAKSAIRHNMAKDLPKMKMPTCIIWGKNDTVTPPRVAEEFHELLPNSDLFWIDKCGHAAMMEHPNQFNEILDKWLENKAL
ncbi:alpha/beta fold hydrolase [Capnocytophaga catalasegens]|uniref:Alpha/beta hydrolase n=1 Tax=Capnocytophaga catalasegens TaxID=1004260 RepID=A0AAV5ARK7_9FLAO|nr:alpha/beta hydrolase [Capnocytophaga catalasegens]GIZ14852.1 alpha/beta hydrolase [Capnocytophaga catalasegens]GJM49189.1 alpha/beta hydrolase [Capnocytophaga catalasegens]GJM52599.1 alpha/beta hydrolase [Capnocytophaga catalasegens]